MSRRLLSVPSVNRQSFLDDRSRIVLILFSPVVIPNLEETDSSVPTTLPVSLSSPGGATRRFLSSVNAKDVSAARGELSVCQITLDMSTPSAEFIFTHQNILVFTKSQEPIRGVRNRHALGGAPIGRSGWIHGTA